MKLALKAATVLSPAQSLARMRVCSCAVMCSVPTGAQERLVSIFQARGKSISRKEAQEHLR